MFELTKATAILFSDWILQIALAKCLFGAFAISMLTGPKMFTFIKILSPIYLQLAVPAFD